MKMTTLPEWANWLARDKDGTLAAYEDQPFKSIKIWELHDNDGDFKDIEETDDTFSHVKWEDEFPTFVDKDRNTFKWLEKPDLQLTKETLNEIFGSKSEDVPSLPEWANWLARDKEGELWAYSVKPPKADSVWCLKTSIGVCTEIEETDDTFSHIKWTDEEPTNIKRGLEAGGVSVAELSGIMNAKAHGYDEVPEMETYTTYTRDKKDMVNRGSLEEKLSELGNAYAPFLEKAGEKAEDTFRKYRSIPEVETATNKDMVNRPNHYIGEYGLEVEDVLRNFIPRYTDPYVGHRIASAIEYLLRSPLKNGQQDIEKAGKNIQQALAYLDMTEEEK